MANNLQTPLNRQVRARLGDIADIHELSTESDARSKEAKESADLSTHKSDVTAKQLTEALKEGDQPAETQAARVNGVTGEVAETLPARLDKDYAETTAQLAQTEQELKGEIDERGKSVRRYGAVGDGWKFDNREAFVEALAENPYVYIPNGTYYISSEEGIDERRLYGDGIVFTKGRTLGVNAVAPATHNSNYHRNNSQMLHKKTYGTYQNAAVLSTIANDNDPKTQVLGLRSPQHASEYGNRDSVTHYMSNRSTKPTVVVTSGTIIYTETSVQLIGGSTDNWENILPGMLIDTYHTPNRYASIIEFVDIEAKRIDVIDGWYEVKPGGSERTSVPAGNIGFDVNRVTKVWGLNNNVFLYDEDPTRAGVAEEIGLWNMKTGGNLAGIDLVNFREKVEYAFQARKATRAPDGFKHAFVARDADNAFANNSNDPEAISFISYLSGDANNLGYHILNNGRLSKLKLGMAVHRNGEKKFNGTSSRILFIHKSVREDFEIHPPLGRAGDILFVHNSGSAIADVITTNGGFVYNGNTISTLRMLGRTSSMLVSDGTNWFVLTGQVEGSAPPPGMKSGAGLPTMDADFIGQEYWRTDNGNFYKAVRRGYGSQDWKRITMD